MLSDSSDKIAMLKQYLIDRKYKPLECVRSFTVGRNDETLVVHFSESNPSLPGEEHLQYYDTPSGIVVMLNLENGRISIPESF